jgi:protein SCO1
MMRPAIICIFLGLAAAPAMAGVVGSQLQGVEAAPAANAALPPGLGFTDDSGRGITLGDAMGQRTAVVVFVDYTCRTLCGPILEFTIAGLSKTGLEAGADYRLIAIGIDPRDRPADARAMRARYLDDANPIGTSARFLTGGEAEVRAVTEAAGFRYAYDAEHDQYAHPAAVYIVDDAGKIKRVLSPLGLDGADLRLAIVDTARDSAGTLADRIHLLCYGYDPVRGIYTERITTFLALASGMTLIVLLSGISLLISHGKRSRA